MWWEKGNERQIKDVDIKIPLSLKNGLLCPKPWRLFLFPYKIPLEIISPPGWLGYSSSFPFFSWATAQPNQDLEENRNPSVRRLSYVSTFCYAYFLLFKSYFQENTYQTIQNKHTKDGQWEDYKRRKSWRKGDGCHVLPSVYSFHLRSSFFFIYSHCYHFHFFHSFSDIICNLIRIYLMKSWGVRR